MNKYLLTLLALGTILGSGKTFAADCVPSPDCASLGYNQNATDCTGSFLKCPWDVSKAACKAGVKPVTCVVGSLLGSNQLCYEKELPDGVKPIAVVFDPANKLAVAPTDAGRAMWAASAYQKTDVIGLTNCSQANMKTCGVDGKENTQKLLIGLNNEYPAASLANTYMPPVCLRFDFCKMGNWFLPSMRDLQNIYDNLSTVNAGLKILDPSVSKEITASANWSSTEASATTAFAANMDYGQHGGYLKNSAYFVRPVINYGASPASYIKFVINISNSCPSGLSFAGTWGNAALNQSGSFSCSSNYCYDQGKYDGNGSNETETVVLEESVITLSNLNSNFKSIKSQVTGRTVNVSNGEAYFTLNDRATILEKNNGGAGYDYWTLQCSQ